MIPPSLAPGLYLVPTPLGHLKDITLRALEVLGTCEIIACEDTRVSRKLLSHYGIKATFMTYHDHNGEEVRPKIIEAIQKGQRVALISDAGTPLISDPGYKLVKTLQEHDLYYTVLPGPCSVITGLALSGMPTDKFSFCGFVQEKDMTALVPIQHTLIFFSTPHKLMKDLKTLQHYFPERLVAVVREISKMFESVCYGSYEKVVDYYTQHPPKGEIVLTLSPSLPPNQEDQEKKWLLIDHIIQVRYPGISAKHLAEELATRFSIPKRLIYQRIVQNNA